MVGVCQVESRRHSSTRRSSTTGSEQLESGKAGQRMARADTEVTTVGGAGFGWGSSKGKGLVSESAPRGSDVLDPNSGAGGGNEVGRGGEGGESGGFAAGRMAVKAAMRFKGRARRGGGGGGRGGDEAEVTSISSHGAQSLPRGMVAGNELNSKKGRANDLLSRGQSAGHAEVLCCCGRGFKIEHYSG
jgi:hypothetical protein